MGGRNTITEKIKHVERLFLENAEELLEEELDPEDWEEYRAIPGATEEELQAFEQQFSITLPEEWKELYRYKNGSGFISLLWPEGEFDCGYRLLSLEEMTKIKAYFQNETREMAEFPDILEEEQLQELDSRIKPYLFCERWFPFAEYEGSLYLMLDYEPSEKGKIGQIICYVHDPDFIYYISQDIAELLKQTKEVLEG